MKAAMKSTNSSSRPDYIQSGHDLEVPEGMSENSERYSAIYRELSSLIGEAAVMKIWKNYAGLTITFPQHLYSQDYIRSFIGSHMEDMTA